MSKLPSMPFFVDAYLADTTHLTLEEHGAYLLLLMSMWRRGGSIPDDDIMTARMLGASPRAWRRLKLRLMPLLQKYGPEGAEMLTQGRLQREWNSSLENSRRQSEKGRRGAEAKWQGKQREGDGRGNGREHGREIASITNKDITFSSTISQQDEGFEEETRIGRLLKTPLMQKASR